MYFIRKDAADLIKSHNGEHSLLLAAEIVGAHGKLQFADKFEPVAAIPAGLSPLYILNGVRYFGKM